MVVALAIALIISTVKALEYKTALRALGIYMQKKGYTQPNDNELRECSQIAVKQMFKWAAK